MNHSTRVTADASINSLNESLTSDWLCIVVCTSRRRPMFAQLWRPQPEYRQELPPGRGIAPPVATTCVDSLPICRRSWIRAECQLSPYSCPEPCTYRKG